MGAIVFDLDGTLVHSAPDIATAANRMLADFALPPLPVAQLTGFIGHGIPALVRRVIEACAIDPAMHAEMNTSLLAHYTARPVALTQPYPGVRAALTALRAQSHSLGVCTNKYHGLSVLILDALDLTPFFDVVIGGDSLDAKKPDPAPLHAAFAALPGAPLLYVGDSEVDAQTAVNAGLDFALFTQGYRQAPVEALPHRFAFNDFADLPPFLRQLAQRDPAAIT